MQPQSKVTSSIVPCLTPIINLASTSGERIADSVRNLGLPTTWILEEARQAKVLVGSQLALADQELAMAVTARSPQRLRTELRNFQAAVHALCGQEIRTVAGDPQQLRSRAALLADQGIEAVVSLTPDKISKPPRLLPCGLWQLNATMSIPQQRRRWAVLPARQPSLSKLLSGNSRSQSALVMIDLGRAGTRELQGFELLLQEISAASQNKQLKVATASQLAARLASSNEVKPQRSILRRAA